MSGRQATRAEATAQPGTPVAGLMQRKCSCGAHAHGAAQCPACAALGPAQETLRGLRIGAPGDRYEREADRVAERIMRSPLPGAGARGDRPAAPPAAVQPISRLSGGPTGATVPAMLGTSGRALDRGTRERMETRLGHDFSRVRVHTGVGAARSARSVGARAYTVGQHIVFGSGQFAPGQEAGQRLLAHELTHTIQQGDRGSQVQRAVEIQPNAAAASDILGQFNSLCPNGNFGVDRNNRITADCRESSPVCDCLCEVATDDTPYVIEVHNVTNNPTSVTLHDNTTETIPMPSVGPHTDLEGPAPTVHMASSTGSALAFGAFRPDGSPFFYDNPRILVHELCSHARLRHTYSGRKGDRQGHDVTIAVENALCGAPVRGRYSDPRQGESFHQLPVSSARKAFALVDGWHYEQVP